MAFSSVVESLNNKFAPLYLVELKSWNFLESDWLTPYIWPMAVRIVMMLLMLGLFFLVTTACPGLNPRLQLSCCPISGEKNGNQD